MSPKNSDAINDSVQILRQRYVQDLDARREVLAGLLGSLKSTDLNALEHAALLELSHKLTGTGATYGFPRVTETARAVELLLTTKAWPPEALITLGPEAGMTQREYRALVGLAHKMSGLCDMLGLKAQADAAAHIEETLDKKIHAPRKALIWHIKALMDACASARTDKPVAFQRDEHAAKPKQPAADEIALSGMRERPLVLIVDDDASTLEILAVHIKAYADVITGKNARAAFELMVKKKPDLVLLDNKMPGAATGVKLLESIRRKPELASIPVVIISASDQSDLIARAFRAGAVDFITKPFDPEDVSARIQRRLDRLGLTILVVDDDAAVCSLLSRTLAAAGFIAQVAWDGRLAVDIMQQKSPDLVLLDYALPGIDGGKVLQAMHDNPTLAAIPVVLLTARKHLMDTLGDAATNQISEYITKPFNVEDVIQHCAKILEKRSA